MFLVKSADPIGWNLSHDRHDRVIGETDLGKTLWKTWIHPQNHRKRVGDPLIMGIFFATTGPRSTV